MRQVGTVFPRCSGGTLNGKYGPCPHCGRLGAATKNGWTRTHEDASGLLWWVADPDLTLVDLAEVSGVSYELLAWTLRLYPAIIEARRVNTEWRLFWQRVGEIVRADRRCRTCGAWPIGGRLSAHPTCSSECDEATQYCGACDQVKPSDEFHKRGRCDSCNRKEAMDWMDNHRGDWQRPTVAKKRCPACDRTLFAESFYRGSNNKSGLQTYCTDCQRRLSKGATVPELLAERGLSYRRTRQKFA